MGAAVPVVSSSSVERRLAGPKLTPESLSIMSDNCLARHTIAKDIKIQGQVHRQRPHVMRAQDWV